MTDKPEHQNPQETRETLVRVRAPYFCAALVLVDGVCTEAAPILKRICLGRDRPWLRKFFKSMSWHASVVRPVPALAGQDVPGARPVKPFGAGRDD